VSGADSTVKETKQEANVGEAKLREKGSELKQKGNQVCIIADKVCDDG